MAGKGCNWLLGCGIGCALLLLLALALVGGGVWFVRDTMQGFDQAIETRQELDERFGEPSAFTPAPDGVVPQDRMQTFIAVREATQPYREQVAASFSALPMSPDAAREMERQSGVEKLRSVLRIGRAGLGLGAGIGDFFEARNRALLDAGMGMGEYTYLYTLVYHAWLGHSPGDGPLSGHARIESGTGTGATRARQRESGLDGIAEERVRAELLAILRNQRDASIATRPDLAAEIAALEADTDRVPWADGLPAATAASFEPFRERLAATYDARTNPFELARNKRHGRFSIQAD